MKQKLLTLLLMAFLPLAMMAYDTEVDGIYYNVIKKAGIATVTSGDNPYTGEVNIPETIVFEGVVCSVTGIGANAFDSCSDLTKVTIPESVTSIGEYAFNGCSSLTSANIPEGVTSISNYAFYGCNSLTSINIPNGVTNIGNYAFYYCSGLTGITIPSSVTSIQSYAFMDCHSFTSITFPNSVTWLGQSVCENCINLTSVTIPGSVKYATWERGFYYCPKLTSVTIGEGVTIIPKLAFDHCDKLTSLTLPSTLTEIRNDAFSPGMPSLTSVNVSVGDNADFCNNKAVGLVSTYVWLKNQNRPVRLIDSSGNEITEFIIPEGVTSIGGSAFKNCTGLTSVTIPSSVTSIGGNAFRDCSGLTSVHISDLAAWCKCSRDGYNPLYYAHHLYLNGDEVKDDVVIPEGVKSISSFAFINCEDITSVTIPEGVTSIGWSTFKDCTGLTSVTIPSSVMGISTTAFANCGNLEVITCKASTVPSTSADAFDGSYVEYATLIVPDDALSDYQATEPWSNFGTIKGNPKVTATNYTREYGEPNPTFEYTSSITLNGEPSITCSATETSAPGVYPIVITQGTETNTGILYVNGTLTITKAPLTITAKKYTVNVGDAMPTFEVKYDGFKNNETADDLTSQPTISCTATDTNTEGTYLITVSGAASDNYDISYVAGRLIVGDVEGEVLMDENFDKSIPFKRIKIKNQKTNNSSYCCVNFSKTPNTNNSDAYINFYTLRVFYTPYNSTPINSGINVGDDWYVYTFDDYMYFAGYQTNCPKDQVYVYLEDPTVRANSYTREYGDPNPEFEWTVTGGVALNGTPSITCIANQYSAPGDYDIEIAQGTVTNDDITYVNGTLTITKAPLTITAKSYTINEGDAMPTFEVEYDGFKNDETADDLTSQPTISCTATDTNTEGTYDITVSGAASDNYDISYVAGKLTVVPTDAHITITSAGMGTYCSPYDLDFTGVTALKAYTIAGYDKANSRVYAMRVYDVPAGTGLYLVGNPGDYDVPISTSNSYYINMLVGTLEQTWIDTTDGDLTNLRLTGTNPSNASFKILSEGRNFSANRAYLQIPTYILGNTANAATAFGIVLDDDTNGIEDIMQSSDDTDSEWYTLDGRKLNGKPTARGIYVVKGRKVVIK